MTALAPLTQFVDGVLVDAAALNNLSTNLDALCQLTTGKAASTGVSSKPALRLKKTTTPAIANNTLTTLTWQTLLLDTDGMATSGSSLITVQVSGWYVVDAQVVWVTAGTGQHNTLLFVNGTTEPTNTFAAIDEQVAASGTSRQQVHAYERFAAGDTIHLAAWQVSGGALTLGAPTDYGGVWLAMTWDAPY